MSFMTSVPFLSANAHLTRSAEDHNRFVPDFGDVGELVLETWRPRYDIDHEGGCRTVFSCLFGYFRRRLVGLEEERSSEFRIPLLREILNSNICSCVARERDVGI